VNLFLLYLVSESECHRHKNVRLFCFTVHFLLQLICFMLVRFAVFFKFNFCTYSFLHKAEELKSEVHCNEYVISRYLLFI